MTSTCENLHAFADGELTSAEHEQFAHHLADCHHCGSGLETIFILGALAEQAQVDRLAAAQSPGLAWMRGAFWRRWRRWRWPNLSGRRLAWVTTALGMTALVLVTLDSIGPGGQGDPGVVLNELQSRPYRSTEARLAAPEFEAYRPLSNERGLEEKAIDSLTTFRQDALGALEARRQHHLLGVIYLLGKQYSRAERALADAPEVPEVWNDRAVLAYLRGHSDDALRWAERALSAWPGYGPALWNRALALEQQGRTPEAVQAFETCAARSEPGWSAEATLRARALRGAVREGKGDLGPR
jgi:cellulose synthase operon protein C